MMKTLEVTIGESIDISLAGFAATLEAALKNQPNQPSFKVGFENMVQFSAQFTPKRWELVEALKAAGPLTIYALAKRLNRHYRNVYKDVTALTEWLVIEKDASGKVFVPWDEIAVRWPLFKQVA